MKIKTQRWTMAALGLCLLSSCDDNPAAKLAPEVAIPVSIVEAKILDSANFVEAAGSVALRNETPLAFTTSGKVARLLVNEGDLVRKGQLLAKLDVTNVAATFEGATAERDRAVAEFARIESLFRDGWVTRTHFETAQAAARASEAKAREGRFNLENAKIVAPSNGIVLARLAEPSQIVASGVPVLILGESSGGFVFRAPISDREVMAIARGTAAEVRIGALERPALVGQVIEIGGRSDRTTGAFEIEIALPPGSALRSGLVGIAKIAANRFPNKPRVIIPPTALFAARAGEGFVFVVDGASHARLRKVRIGETSDAGSEIISGLSSGERVAITSLDRLRDGINVSIIARR